MPPRPRVEPTADRRQIGPRARSRVTDQPDRRRPADGATGATPSQARRFRVRLMPRPVTVGSGHLAHDTPWLWYRLVAKANGPLWVPSVLLFIALYAVAASVAALAGELPRFVRDIRWLAPLGLPALNSLVLSYVPRIMDRWWDGLVPWLSNSDEEIAALRAMSPRILTRFFWPLAIFLTALVGQYVVVGAPGNWTHDYRHPQVLSAVSLIAAPFVGYFVGGAAAVATIGLGMLVRRMSRPLQFRRGFTLEGGKEALRPFNRLLWLIWGVMTPTLLVVLVADAALSPAALGSVLTTALAIAVTLSSVVVPQLFMNRWLHGAKERELGGLRNELRRAAATPRHAGAGEGVRRLLRHDHLLYKLHRAEAFAPTLIDTGLALQILVSVTATILADVLLHTPVADWLP